MKYQNTYYEGQRKVCRGPLVIFLRIDLITPAELKQALFRNK